jgi:two-component system CheB/CheR fusion protein
MKTNPEKTVLIVDDNKDAVEALSTLLQVSGYETSTAHNGYSACDAARDHIPSVIIMDLGMPWMDGYEAVRTIRRMPGAKQIPIIAVSGNSQPDTQKKALAAGFSKHLSKPLDYDKLAQYLEEVA